MRIKHNINQEFPGHVEPTYESDPCYVTAGFKCDYCGFVTKSFGEWMPKNWRRFMFSPTKWKDACPSCRDRAQQEYDKWEN